MPSGVDEAGRGPVLGPLVICALHSPDPEWLFDLGVRDSKITTAERRYHLYDILSERCSYSIVSIPAGTIDSARKGMTMNSLEVHGFSSVIASLILGKPVRHPDLPEPVTIEVIRGGMKIDRIYLDAADVDADRFGTGIGSELNDLGISIPEIVSEHRADGKYPVVSAASIVAKVTRDRRIGDIAGSIGEDIGSGYPSDPVTRKFLEEWIRRFGDLPDFARRSWDTSKNLLRQIGQSRLTDF
jgi:ribonuclease HII